MPSGAAYRSGHVRARILPPHRQQIPHRSDPKLTISALWQSQKAARSGSIIRSARRRRVWQIASDSYDCRRGWQRPDCRCGARRGGRRRRRSGREHRCRCRCSGCESSQCRAAGGRGAASSADSGTDGWYRAATIDGGRGGTEGVVSDRIRYRRRDCPELHQRGVDTSPLAASYSCSTRASCRASYGSWCRHPAADDHHGWSRV